MKFVPTTEADLPVSGRPSSKSAQFFEGFLGQDDVTIAEVELDPEAGDKTPDSVRSSLDNYIQRHDLPIVVFTRAGRLFIQKSDTKPSERPKRTRKSKADNGTADAGEGTEVATDELPEGVEAVEDEYAGI